jgi:hypothetical protein
LAAGRDVLARERDVLEEGRDGLSGGHDVSTQRSNDFVRESDFLQGEITHSIVSSLNFVGKCYELRGISILIEVDIRKNRYFW